MGDEELSRRQYPFDIKYDDEIDPSSVTMQLQFSETPDDKARIESKVKEWARKGIEVGYAGKFIHYIDDEPDEEGEGGFEWNDEDNYLEFFVDMGGAEDEALSELFSSLSDDENLIEIRIGSGYEW